MSDQTLKRHVPVDGQPGLYWKDERRLEIGCRFVDSDGRRQYAYGSQPQHGGRPWTTIKTATRARAALTTDLDRDEVVISAKAPTFAEVVREWQQARTVRGSTAEAYDRNLRNYCAAFDRRRINAIDKAAVLVWLGRLRSKKTGGELSPGAKLQVFCALDAVFEHACDTRRIVKNPCRDLKRGQRPKQGELSERILTPDEEARLLAYCGSFEWLRPIIEVTLYQALRIGETLGLRRRDVDLANGKLHVRGQLRRDGTWSATKTDHGDGRYKGTIDLHPRSRELLLDLIANISPDELVFRNGNGNGRAHSDVSRAFRKARTLAGLTDDPRPLRIHDLRHTAISRMANDPRVPLVFTQRFARHEKLETTLGYVHPTDSAVTTGAAMEALNGGS